MSDLVLSLLRGAEEPADAPAGREAPARRRRVFVDREGRIVVGDDVAPTDGEGRRLSEIHPAVFA